MTKYIIKRILSIIPVMLGVITLVFVMRAVMPGDPVSELLPQNATEAERVAMREKLGLDDPLIVQYSKYVWGIITRGDLGVSYKTKQPVMFELWSRIPRTVTIGLLSLLVSQIIGNPLGILAAVKQYTWVDNLIIFFSIIGASIPTFWLALMMIKLFSVDLGWLPAIFNGSFLGYLMPITVTAFGQTAATARGVRTSMLEMIRQDYVKTARAKGQKESIVIVRHAFRNAAVPCIQGLGHALGNLLGGSLIMETVFGVPGVGKYISDAVTARDFPVVQGGIVVLALVYTIVNILVDMSYTIADPRLKSTLVRKAASNASA